MKKTTVLLIMGLSLFLAGCGNAPVQYDRNVTCNGSGYSPAYCVDVCNNLSSYGLMSQGIKETRSLCMATCMK